MCVWKAADWVVIFIWLLLSISTLPHTTIMLPCMKCVWERERRGSMGGPDVGFILIPPHPIYFNPSPSPSHLHANTSTHTHMSSSSARWLGGLKWVLMIWNLTDDLLTWFHVWECVVTSVLQFLVHIVSNLCSLATHSLSYLNIRPFYPNAHNLILSLSLIVIQPNTMWTATRLFHLFPRGQRWSCSVRVLWSQKGSWKLQQFV